jgi:hypothetical protein
MHTNRYPGKLGTVWRSMLKMMHNAMPSFLGDGCLGLCRSTFDFKTDPEILIRLPANPTLKAVRTLNTDDEHSNQRTHSEHYITHRPANITKHKPVPHIACSCAWIGATGCFHTGHAFAESSVNNFATCWQRSHLIAH